MLTKIQNPRITYFSRILAIPLVALVVLAFSFKTSSITKLEKNITVVIDAGHGFQTNGQPSGAMSNGLNEDEIVLSLAKKVKELNKNDKVQILLTRETSNIVELHSRVDYAKEKNADLFISLHLAAAPGEKPGSGMEVYVSNKNTPYQRESELLGSALKQELASIYTTNPELIKRSVGIWVLDKNICPSVLVECGFITDKTDRAFISNAANQEKIANSILSAIQRFAATTQNGEQAVITDTLPGKKPVDIAEVNVEKNKGLITITYKDGRKETMTIDQARQKNIIKNEGKPGKKSNSVVVVKNASPKAKPLYYVDGKEFNGTLDKLDPTMIQSVNVLKDKPAIAKYGEKGKNGVIEIITKPGDRQNIFDTIPKTN